MTVLEFDTTSVAIAPIEPADGETRRRAEQRTVLGLMRHLTGLPDAVIAHYHWGEPCIALKPAGPGEKCILKPPAINISISHSRRLAAVAIDPARPIGIDIEEPRSQLFNVATRFLSAEERRLLNLRAIECDTRPGSFTIFSDLSNDDYTALLERLTRAWTFKEAMVKLCGGRTVNMRDDLRAIPAPAIWGEPCTVIADTDIDGHHLAILTR